MNNYIFIFTCLSIVISGVIKIIFPIKYKSKYLYVYLNYIITIMYLL